MKFLEVFHPIEKGNFGLTEEAIYKSIQAGPPYIPLWGGNREHSSMDRMISANGKTKSGEVISIFEGKGIVISLDGSSGSMTYKCNQRFSLNHHAGFFKLKKEAEKKIIPEYFVLFFENILQNASISEGSKTLTLDQIYSIDFTIPPYQKQKSVLRHIQPLLIKRNMVSGIIQHIQSLKDRFVSHDYKKYQVKSIPIKGVMDYLSGNSGLTESVIYKNLKKDGKRYPVLSSSTEENTRMGMIPLCEIEGRKIKVFEQKEGLLVIRNGKAGATHYLPKGSYTINDHAYILFLKNGCKYKIDLKWLSIQYRDEFLAYSSSSDNGTWNMTGFFEHVLIDIPSYGEQQSMVREYERLDLYCNRLERFRKRVSHLLSKSIIEIDKELE